MKSKNLLLVTVLVTAFLAGNLFAGFDTALNPIETDTINVTTSEIINGTEYSFDGSVEYAVYAPGDYPGMSGNYVYAYQVTNNVQGSNLNVSQFSLGLLPDSGVGIPSVTCVSASGEVNPMAGFGSDDAVLFMYLFNPITPGQSSALMLFSSPNGPVDGYGSLTVGSIGSVNVALPTPVPEPVTLILLGAGCLPLSYLKKRSRKVA